MLLCAAAQFHKRFRDFANVDRHHIAGLWVSLNNQAAVPGPLSGSFDDEAKPLPVCSIGALTWDGVDGVATLQSPEPWQQPLSHS